jgi:hypothetical protein
MISNIIKAYLQHWFSKSVKVTFTSAINFTKEIIHKEYNVYGPVLEKNSYTNGKLMITAFYTSNGKLMNSLYTPCFIMHNHPIPVGGGFGDTVMINPECNIVLHFYYNDELHHTHELSKKYRVEKYYKDNELHREDGPAFIKYSKDNEIVHTEYWENGNIVTNQVLLIKNLNDELSQYDIKIHKINDSYHIMKDDVLLHISSYEDLQNNILEYIQ